jgi:hypothetical protein
MKLLTIPAALAAFFGVTDALRASSPAAWEMNTYQDFIKGRFTGLSLSRDGRMMLAPKLETVLASDQPVVWSVARAPDGSIFAATGHRGRLFRITPDGKSSIFWTAEQPEIFAVAVSGNAVLAATSPDGKIFRVEAGKALEYFAPKARYIWSLAVDSSGTIYAGADEGRIFRITGPGQGEVWYETGQSHVTSLAVDPQGRLLAGTEPNGILYRVTGKDRAFVLYDANLPEIRAIVASPDGNIYAAALGGAMAGRGAATGTPASISSSSITVTSPPTSITVTEESTQAGLDIKPKADASKQAAAAATPQVTTQVTPILDLSGVEKSAIYRIQPDNAVETLWSSKDENAYDLLPFGNYLAFGTDLQGRVYRLSNDRKTTLLVQTNENETLRLLHDGKALLAATSNLGKIYRLGEGWSSSGGYESPIHDSGTVARWGRLSWRADTCAGCKVGFRTRTGNSARPDKTWSDWSELISDAASAAVPSPNARYIQWKLEMAGANGDSPVVDAVTVAYLPQNTAPVVRTITVATQPASAARDKGAAQSAAQAQTSAYSITVTDTADGSSAATSSGTPAQAIARASGQQLLLTWQADDADGDKLLSSVWFRGEGEREWKTLKTNLQENTLTLESDVLADGKYYFRVVASDKSANPPGRAREGELISVPIIVDNTPPLLTMGVPRRDGQRVEVDVDAADSSSALRRAEYSLDAVAWVPVEAADGVLDSPRERFVVRLDSVSPGEHLLVVRAYDSVGNAGLAKTIVR